MLTKKVYLAGSIETAKDGGVGWRSTITPMLKSVGYTVFNPCVSEHERIGKTSEEIQRVLSICKKVGDFNRLKLIMSEIKSADLSAVDGSDFIIVFLEHMESHPGGTYEEIMYAKMTGKPVLGLCLGDISTENSWILDSCLRSGGLFFTYESVISHLRKQIEWWGFDWVSNIPKLEEFKR